MAVAPIKEEEARDQAWLCGGPCLMVCHGTELTLYDVSQKTHRTKVSQELANKHMFGSQGEWVLARDCKNKSDCCILNAVTLEKIQVPALNKLKLYLSSSFFLCGSPGAADCTMYVTSFAGGMNVIFAGKIGSDEFSEIGSGLYQLKDHAVAVSQGKMYYVEDYSYTLKCAQLQGDSVKFETCIQGNKLEDQLLFRGYSYLVESCDHQLLYIHQRDIEMGVADFQVFGADLGGKVWEKVDSIGSDRAIFLDRFRGFSVPVPPGGFLKGNCIYYVSEIDPDDSNNVVNWFRYDLEDGFVTMLPRLPFKIHPKHPYGPDLIWINCSSIS